LIRRIQMSKTAKICYADAIARYHLPAAGRNVSLGETEVNHPGASLSSSY